MIRKISLNEMIFLSWHQFWIIYLFPILIAIISAYINNCSSMYSIRINRVDTSIDELHELKKRNIYNVLSGLIVNTTYEDILQYKDVVEILESLKNIYNELYNPLDVLKLNIKHVRMRKCESIIAWNLLKKINMDISYVHMFVFKIWGAIEYKLRNSPKNKQMDRKYVAKVADDCFNNAASLSTSQIMASLKVLNSDIDSLRELLYPLGNTLLLCYEFKRSFLGRELGKRMGK